jgi:hypothetical protein
MRCYGVPNTPPSSFGCLRLTPQATITRTVCLAYVVTVLLVRRLTHGVASCLQIASEGASEGPSEGFAEDLR